MRVYTEEERRQAGGNASRLAGDFAVKEAVSKVFGTGFRGFGLLDIEVLRDEFGKPWVQLHGGSEETCGQPENHPDSRVDHEYRQSCIRLRSRRGGMEMRRLVTGKQMKEIDGYAIRKVGIPSLVLMERAALAVADEMEKTVWEAFRAEASGILRNGQ